MKSHDEHMIRSKILDHFSKMLGDIESSKIPAHGVVIKETHEMPPMVEMGHAETPEGPMDMMHGETGEEGMEAMPMMHSTMNDMEDPEEGNHSFIANLKRAANNKDDEEDEEEM